MNKKLLLILIAALGTIAPTKAADQQEAPTKTMPSAVQPSQATPPGDMKMQGNLHIDTGLFKGTLQFDGNPLSIIQSAQPTAKPADGVLQQANPSTDQRFAIPANLQAPSAVPYGQYPMQGAPNPIQSGGYPVQQGNFYPQQPAADQRSALTPYSTPPASAFPGATPAAPAAPMIDMAGIQKAATAVGSSVMQALPHLNKFVQVDPRLLKEGQKLLQSVFPATPPSQPGAPMSSAAPAPPANFEWTPELVNAVSQLRQSTQYNLQMCQEGAYLASFGEPSLRMAAAMEAQKNANEARAASEQVTPLHTLATGQTADMITAIRETATQCQAFADQAREHAGAGNELTP